MAKDHWPNLHDDPYALARLKKSIKACDIREGHSILDVGCHQEEARQFIPAGCHYLGLDHLKGDDFDGGFSLHQKFDRILCLEVLEHLMWPRKTLASIASHLETSGICAISLPNEATLFHRLRGFLGCIDAEAFGEFGKHLHLPNLQQARSFVESEFQITHISYYISPSACGSRQKLIGLLMKIIPDRIWNLLADSWPSLFARGFIFVCKKK